MKRHFLLLGAARGGTTLLTHCLDSHPSILCLREFGDRRLRGQRDLAIAILRRTARWPLLVWPSAVIGRWILTLPEPQDRQAGRLRPARLVRADQFYAKIHRRLSSDEHALSGNKIITDSLVQLYRPPYVHGESLARDRFCQIRRQRLDYFCNSLFAGYQFVFITRDGRRVVQSKMRRERATQSAACAGWLESVRVHQALAEILGERLLTVKFEELVSEPIQTLQRVCAFLAVAYDDQMLAGAQRPYLREPNQGFNLDRIGVVSGGRLDAVLREGLLYFGYEIAPAGDGPDPILDGRPQAG